MAYLDEGFKWIRGYEGYYSINKEGKIASYHKVGGRGKGWVLKETPQMFLKPQTQHGCLVVNLNDGNGQKRFRVKRLVAESFLSYDKNSDEEVYHKDRDYCNCSADNLYFSGSHSDVMKHYIYTPEFKKKQVQKQINKIEKRQAKIEASKEKINKELEKVKKYYSEIH